MSRRVKLPGADELFRPTKPLPEPATRAESGPPADGEPVRVELAGVERNGSGPPAAQPAATHDAAPDAKKSGPSGRVKHDEKITVYVTADELLDLEHTRLTLRRDHGLAVDRGRIVREAIHLALAGVETDGDASALVRRLREQ